jgi:hypothetical protein
MLKLCRLLDLPRKPMRYESPSGSIEPAVKLRAHILRNAGHELMKLDLGVIADKFHQIFICLTKAVGHGTTSI